MIKNTVLLRTLFALSVSVGLISCDKDEENNNLPVDCDINYTVQFEDSCTYEGDHYILLEVMPGLIISDSAYIQIIKNEIGHLLPEGETGCIIRIQILVQKDSSSCVELVKDNFITEINYQGLAKSLSSDTHWISGKKNGIDENLSTWLSVFINEGQIIDVRGI